jgi:hypothetical protein
MATIRWPERLAYAFAILRGTMLVVFAVFLMVAPEQAMPGSEVEPARSLGLIVASRTILLGSLMIGLTITRKHEGLGWVLLADAALQVFDAGMSIAMGKGAATILPIALGALDAWVGRFLLQSARTSPRSR